MPSAEWDVVVVGAGASGLTAYRDLSRAGLRVLCLEARDRIGGRLATVHDPFAPVPVELGAEFVHGRPPETWDLVRQAGLTLYDCKEKALRIRGGKPDGGLPSWDLVGEVLEDMQRVAASGPDVSFEEFLERSQHPQEAKRLATSYVEGFNAARKDVVSIQALSEDARAADAIGGDQSYRILNGYDALALHILRGACDSRSTMHLNAAVQKVHWSNESVTLDIRDTLTGVNDAVRARRAVITVPLGVLQAGTIRFVPDLPEMLEAACRLKFGQVFRLVFRFREAFWNEKEDFADAGFLLSDEKHFPTWWTTLPVHAPILTGWAAGARGEELLGRPREEIVNLALGDLARITGYSRSRLHSFVEAIHFHPWHQDPFALGAYSYVPAGAIPARKVLAQTPGDTLYFAGEATELNGHSATVHGAIATGRRAAERIIAA